MLNHNFPQRPVDFSHSNLFFSATSASSCSNKTRMLVISCDGEQLMQYEVEQKHRVVDVAALEAQLSARRIRLEPAIIQSDEYFAHPARDFAKTDEALRIRTSGGKSFVTYKGPKLDA